MKKFKYLLFLFSFSFLFIFNIKAFNIKTINGNSITDEVLYNDLSTISGWSYELFPYVLCTSYTSTDLFCYSFSSLQPLTTPNTGTTSKQLKIGSSNSLNYIYVGYYGSYNGSNADISTTYLNSYAPASGSGYLNLIYKYPSSNNSVYFTYTNFNLTDIPNFTMFSGDRNSNHKKIDFEQYATTTYMELSILDSSYNELSNVDCIDNTSEYCSITSTSSDTRYLKVLYHLNPLLGQSLDIFNNSIQQVNTKILNTVNPYITVKQVYLEYNYGDSVSNVSNNLYFVNGSNSYNVYNQSYNFVYSFKQNDEYNSIYLYDFAVYYDLGAVPYTEEMRIPYYITFKTITSGDGLPNEDSQEQQEQQQIDQNQVIIDNLDDINNSINNTNIGGANNNASNFFTNFSTDDFGLSSIITIPLSSINSLASSTCSPLSVPIPNTGKSIVLPCMTQVYQQNVPEVFSLWQIVSFGIIAYFIGVDIFHIVKGFKEPDSDKVEVLDL